MPLHFKYLSSRVPDINREWLRLMTESSNSPSGLVVPPEPRDPGTSTVRRPVRPGDPVPPELRL